MPLHRRVNIITRDTELTIKIRLSRRHGGAFKLLFSQTPLLRADIDAYVAPEAVFLSSEIMEHISSQTYILGYGAAALLDAAFCSGCDDYMKEPWSPSEMYTRLTRFKIRQAFTAGPGRDLLTLHGQLLYSNSSAARLTAHETLILRTLMKNHGTPVPRETFSLILDKPDAARRSRSVDMHIAALRKKIRTLAPEITGQGPITTVRHFGYMLNGLHSEGKPVEKIVDN